MADEKNMLALTVADLERYSKLDEDGKALCEGFMFQAVRVLRDGLDAAERRAAHRAKQRAVAIRKAPHLRLVVGGAAGGLVAERTLATRGTRVRFDRAYAGQMVATSRVASALARWRSWR